MKIRKFRKQDAVKASYLIRRTMQHSLPVCYSQQVVDALCNVNTPAKLLKRAEKRTYYVAIENDRLIGFSGLLDNQIKTFFVHPSWQGKGVGRLLFEKVENVAKKKG